MALLPSRRGVAAFLLLVAVCADASAQTASPPTCTVSSLPEVRGLQAGTQLAAVKSRFPHFVAPPRDIYGFSEYSYDFTLQRGRYESYGDESHEPLEGIDRKGLAFVGVGFLDDTVVVLAVAYDTRVEWGDVKDFLTAISGPLKLPPPGQWRYQGRDAAEYTCDSYLITATTRPRHGDAGIRFQWVGLPDEIEKRKTALEERRRKAFKP